MTGARNNGTRKSMRAIPLTQRQRKHGKPEVLAPQLLKSAPPHKKEAHTPRKGRPELIQPTSSAALAPTTPLAPLASMATAESIAPTAPLISPHLRPLSPLDLNAESGVRQAPTIPETPAEPLDMQDTVWLSAPPKAETQPVVMTPTPESGALIANTPSDPGAPRRVKVRVRRKRATPAPQSAAPSDGNASEVNAEMEETVILPTLAQQGEPSGITLNITLDSETVMLARPLETPPTREVAPAQVAALDAETTVLNPGRVETPRAKKPAPPTVEKPLPQVAALDTETTILDSARAKAAPTASPDVEPSDAWEPGDTAPAGEPEAPQTPEASETIETPPAEPTPEPRQVVTTRKLPTLAVMAALAARAEVKAEVEAEARVEAEAQEIEAREDEHTEERPGRDEPREDEPYDQAYDQAYDQVYDEPGGDEPQAEETLQQSPEEDIPANKPEAAPEESDEKLLSDLRALLSDPPSPPATARTSASTRPAPTRPGARGGRATPQPLTPTPSQTASQPHPSAPKTGNPLATIKRGMWWLNTLQPAKQAKQAKQAKDERVTPDEALQDAPRDATNGRAAEAPRTTPEIAPRARPITQPLAPRRAPVITRQLEREAERAREAETSRDRWQFRRAQPSDGRVETKEPQEKLSSLLTWVGVGQAALCGISALVAAIALLNGSAGARAISVFTWAITFALIAGSGAGLAHLAWRMKRARLATLALLLSQLGLLIWAFILLGARPALMVLAFFSVALAMRGLGRPAAMATGLSALALFALTLALNASAIWGPAVSLTGPAAAILDATLITSGMALMALALGNLYATDEREWARTRAIERAARLAARERDALRTQTEDDADMLRQALSNARRGVPTEGVRARGALSPLAEQINVVAEQLVDLSYDREERKRLESATRRLIRNMERAWLGLSWEWPEASGVILDDLIALLRTPPPSEPTQLPEDTTPTAQIVAPHLYRAWQPGISMPSQPLLTSPTQPLLTPSSQPLAPQMSLWPGRSTPSQPSGVWQSLWPSEPESAAPGTDPLALPPSPRWRASDLIGLDGLNGLNGLNGSNGANSSHPGEAPIGAGQ